MKVSQWITNRLIELGIARVYALPGGFLQNLLDPISHSDLQVIWMLDERAAAFAACADAQYTGKLAITITTAGPGSTNLLTGIASAFDDSLPILCICGEINTIDLKVKRKYNLRVGSAQDVDMINVAKPIVKYVNCAMNPEDVKTMFFEAIKAAMKDRRGPALLQIPLDIQGMEI